MSEFIAQEELKEFTQVEQARIAAAETMAADMAKGAEWERWAEIGEVLLIGRRLAMRIAVTNKPDGRRYADAYSMWLDLHPNLRELFPNKASMSELLWILDSAENRQILLDVRSKMTSSERARVSTPSAMRKRIAAVLKARQKPEGEEPVEHVSLKKRVVQLEAELEQERKRKDRGSLFDIEFDNGKAIGKVLAAHVSEHKWREIVKAADAVFAEKRKAKSKPAG